MLKEPTFVKLNETDNKKADQGEKLEKKQFNEIFKKDVKKSDYAILFITFIK